MKQSIENIRELIERNELQDAINALKKQLEEDEKSAELHNLLGQIYMKQAAWGDAINCFSRTLEIDPQYPGAANRIEMSQSILGFFNPDLLNP